MSNVCEITGKKRLSGHRVSHANNKTNHFHEPNTRTKSFFIECLGQSLSIKVCSEAIRWVSKYETLSALLVKMNPPTLSTRLKRLRKKILEKGF